MINYLVVQTDKLITIYKSVLDRHIKNTPSRHVSKGNIIYYQGEVPKTAAVLKSGSVKVYNLSPAGEEQLVTFHVPVEVFPSSWIFGQTPGTVYFYEAFTDCEIVFIPKEEIIKTINKSSSSTEAFLAFYTNSYMANMLRITALQQAKAGDKIAYTLYYLCHRYGKPDKNGFIEIGLPLTHQQFASLVGLTRETTATEMKKLEKQNIVNYKKQLYRVNRSLLLRHIGDESFKDIKI